MRFAWNSDLAGEVSPFYCEITNGWTAVCLIFGGWTFRGSMMSFSGRGFFFEFLLRKQVNLRIHCGVFNSGDFPNEYCTNPLPGSDIYLPSISEVSLLHFKLLSLGIPTRIRDAQIASGYDSPSLRRPLTCCTCCDIVSLGFCIPASECGMIIVVSSRRSIESGVYLYNQTDHHISFRSSNADSEFDTTRSDLCLTCEMSILSRFGVLLPSN